MSALRVVLSLRFVLSVVLCAMAFSATADAQPSAPLELTAENLARVVDPLMAQWVGEHKGAGAVVIVVSRDAELFARGYGFADIAARKPFTPDATLVRPGSISKLFTAIAVMQLVDAGKLDLDRDVNGYLDFAIPTPEGGVPVTLRRLLTHRAGFEDHLKGLFSRERQAEPLGRWVAKSLPRRLFPAGDVEAYSNYGLALAGYIVERAAGEPYAAYVQRHILDPLGMRRSTFRQPLPDDLAPLMAQGYRRWDDGPLGFFETIAAPAGALTATGADMGRFVRALLNGGTLDGARILSEQRLGEMMAPQSATAAGFLGLAFFGTKVAGHDAIGHVGGTMVFFSDLKLFPAQGIGIFVSRDGLGDARQASQIGDPATVIAQRFLRRETRQALDKAPQSADTRAATTSGAASVAGIYQLSQREESSLVRLNALATQSVIRLDSAGDARLFAAFFPFGEGAALRRLEPDLYEVAGARIAFVDEAGRSYLAQPAARLQRVPFWLDARWIVPALALSVAVALLTLLGWPFGALWRFWRGRRGGQERKDRQENDRNRAGRHKYLAVRLVLLVDLAVVAATAILFRVAVRDVTHLNDALDPFLGALYAFAWLGVVGALLALWVAISFWRDHAGSRWSRLHHTLIAASSLMLAWFFITFRIAGTTLNY